MVCFTPSILHLVLLCTPLLLVGFVRAQVERPEPEAPLLASVSGIVDCKAVIEIKNRSAREVYWLNRFLSDRGELIAEILDVRGAEGALPYTGVLAEMMPPTVEDFERLKPGESYRFEIGVANYYPIEPGKRYELRVSTFVAWFPAPLQPDSLEAVSIAALKSAPVSFTCTNRGVQGWWIALSTAVAMLLVGLLAFRRRGVIRGLR